MQASSYKEGKSDVDPSLLNTSPMSMMCLSIVKLEQKPKGGPAALEFNNMVAKLTELKLGQV